MKRKVLSIILSICMLASICVMSVNAAGIEQSGGSDTTKVELTVESATFKVTVPTVLPYTVDADGNVSVADNAKIVNESNGPVKVTDVTAKTLDSWKLVENGTDFRSVKVNSPEFTMTLNNDNFPAGTTSVLPLGSAWTPINGGADMSLTYSGDFAEQADAITNANIANVIFTVAWYSV